MNAEALIGSKVYVVPKNGEAPFIGVLQQPLFNDDWYVRDNDNDLCGPYDEDELNLPLRSGTLIEYDQQTHVVVYNQGALDGDPDPTNVTAWLFDPQDYSRLWVYRSLPVKDIQPYGDDGMKNLEAQHPDHWLRVLRTEAAAIKAKYGSIW